MTGTVSGNGKVRALMKHRKRNDRNMKRILLILAIVLAVCVGGYEAYVHDYYKADEAGLELITEVMHTDSVRIPQTKGNSWIGYGDSKSKTGIIFYGGAKVDEKAYLPLLYEIAEEGYYVVLAQMPDRLAVWGVNKADQVIAENPDITNWFIGGHSLGGAMAASYAAEHPQKLSGLFLLAAYSTGVQTIPVLSVYGENDRILNAEKYETYKANLPEGYTECILSGANHAGFGCYGAQKGDGEAEISQEQQREETVKAMVLWMQETIES